MIPRIRLPVVAILLASACAPAGPRRAGVGAPSGPATDTARATTPEPFAAPGPPSADVGAPTDPREREMARLVNEHRRAAGCRELDWDAELAEVARAHSASMRAAGYFDHVDAEGRDAFARLERAGIRGWRVAAENIALSSRPPAGILGMWLGSPGHRANLENCDLTRHGIGRVEGFWTHVFTG